MKLIIKNNINELINIDDDFLKNNVQCFQYIPVKGLYNFYVFTCDFESENELIKVYSIINDIIAYDFQRKLLKDIEKWNLYLFLFVKDKISEEGKALVEQNKYATRKLVFDNTMTGLSFEKKEELIINKLFDLNVTDKRSKRNEEHKGVQHIIEQEDPILLKTIEDFKRIKGKRINEKEKKTKIVKSYLELKKNE